MPTINTALSREQVREIVHQLPALLSGQQPDPTGTVQEMFRELGTEALTLIHEAFLHKSKGGVDEAGISWPRLSRRYVAYGREHGGRKPKKQGERPRGLLTTKQDERWRKIFAGTYQRLLGQGSADAGANAAALAWHILKLEGAHTALDVYGNRQPDMLVKSGELLASLTPGSGHPAQIFEISPGTVKVGSRLPYAEAHNKGVPSRNLPARPFKPQGPLPERWRERFNAIIARYTGILLQRLLERGGVS